MIQEENGPHWYSCDHCPWPIGGGKRSAAGQLNRQKREGPLPRCPVDCQLPHANQYKQHPQPFRPSNLCSHAQCQNVEAKQQRADSGCQYQILNATLPNEREFVEILQRVRHEVYVKANYFRNVSLSLNRDVHEQPFTRELIFKRDVLRGIL